MSHQRDPDLDDNWRVFDEVVAYMRSLVGPDGTERLEYVESGRIGLYGVEPINPRARRIDVIAEHFFIVAVGDDGGCWELGYPDEDATLARRIIAAAVAGRIQERKAFGRAQVVVTLAGGESIRESGYSGCSALLVPQPGWTRWGKRIRYQPYRRP